MSKEQHLGQRKERSFEKRYKKLGYYIIYTDTRETEINYINGFRDSLSEEFKSSIDIKVATTKTSDLIKCCKEYVGKNPQYSSAWLVFDRDEVKDFDKIILEATKNNIHVAWSNPCIEIWFSSYLGKISCVDSITCCSNFAKLYKNKTQKKYKKNDKNIYDILNKYGEESKAIKYFQTLYKNKLKQNLIPSKQFGMSQMFILINEIKELINNN